MAAKASSYEALPEASLTTIDRFYHRVAASPFKATGTERAAEGRSRSELTEGGVPVVRRVRAPGEKSPWSREKEVTRYVRLTVCGSRLRCPPPEDVPAPQRPPGPPLPSCGSACGSRLWLLLLLPLRLRRSGRPRLGLRLPYPADDVLVAGAGWAGRGHFPPCPIPGGDPERPGGDGGPAPFVCWLPRLDWHGGSSPLPGPLLRCAGQAGPHSPWPEPGEGAGDLVRPFPGGRPPRYDGRRPGQLLQRVAGSLLWARRASPPGS